MSAVEIIHANGKNVVLLKKIKNGKKREKNGNGNNLTLLHLLLHFKIKTLFAQFNFNQQKT